MVLNDEMLENPTIPEATTVAANDTSNGTETMERIVGGNETEPHSIPWQVGLTWKLSNRPWCGGSIIDGYTILTAAHCCQGNKIFTFLN